MIVNHPFIRPAVRLGSVANCEGRWDLLIFRCHSWYECWIIWTSKKASQKKSPRNGSTPNSIRSPSPRPWHPPFRPLGEPSGHVEVSGKGHETTQISRVFCFEVDSTVWLEEMREYKEMNHQCGLYYSITCNDCLDEWCWGQYQWRFFPQVW